jgi:outer membrane protein TolC
MFLRIGIFSLLLAGLQACSSLPVADHAVIQRQLSLAQPQLESTLTRLEQPDREPSEMQALLQQPLTPALAQQIALLGSPMIAAAMAELGIAEARELQASLLSNPGFSITALRPEGGGRWQLDLGLSQSILDWLTRPLRQQLSKDALLLAQLQLLQQVNQQLDGVLQDYYAALTGRHQLEIIRSNLAAARASEELATAMYEAGNISELNQLQLSSEAQTRQSQLWAVEAEAQQAVYALNERLGLDPDTELQIPAVLNELPVADNFEFNQLLETAQTYRPEFRIAEQSIALSQQGVEMAERFARWNSLDGSLELEREFDGSRNTGFGLELTLPLFDQGQARRAGSRAAADHALAERSMTSNRVAAQIAGALTAMQSARRQLEQLQEVIIPRQERMLILSLQEYNFMLSDAFVLLQIKQAELDARLEHANALASYWLARSALAAAAGLSLDNSLENPLDNPLQDPAESVQPATPEQPQEADEHQHHEHQQAEPDPEPEPDPHQQHEPSDAAPVTEPASPAPAQEHQHHD